MGAAWPASSTLDSTVVAAHKVVLEWSPAERATGYRVEIDGARFEATTSNQTYTVHDLAPNTRYRFQVQATGSDGVWTTNGPIHFATTIDAGPPTWPQGTLWTDELAATSVTLKWSEAVDDKGVTGYEVLQDGATIGAVNGKTLAFDVDGLIPSTDYRFRVQATDLAEHWSKDGPQVDVRTLDGGAPVWPEASEVTATSVGPNAVTLSWTPATDDDEVVDYRVHESGAVVGTIHGAKTTYAVLGLESATEHTFQIQARDPPGNWSTGGPSVVVTTLDAGPPTWPVTAELAAVELAPTWVTLGWTAAEDDDGVIGYRIYQDSVLVAELPEELDTALPLEHTIENLTTVTEYVFQVEAGDPTGAWTQGPLVTLKTPDSGPPVWAGDAALDATPSGDAVALSWPPATDDHGVVAYRVYRDGALLATLTSDEHSYVALELESLTEYTLAVQAGDAAGNWSSDGLSLVISTLDGGPPTWPAGSVLTAADVTDKSLVLSWFAAVDDGGVTEYVVKRGADTLATVEADTLSLLVEGLDAQTQYSFEVQARDAAGYTSADGPALTITTL